MNSAARILIVEDDLKIAALLVDYFKANGYATTHLADGKIALEHIRKEPVDLVILDLMLPGMDGLQVCQAVRQFSEVPIIMLTARVDEVDRLLGLESGADDYVCKPFSPREVVARAKVQLRRSKPGSAAQKPLVVDRTALRIVRGDSALNLTPVEFRLLAELIDHPDRVYSRTQLLNLVYEDQRDINDRTVDSHIKNLRKKLDAQFPGVDCLQSVYGVGYRFEMPV
jgi:two-component system response regulator BaeR